MASVNTSFLVLLCLIAKTWHPRGRAESHKQTCLPLTSPQNRDLTYAMICSPWEFSTAQPASPADGHTPFTHDIDLFLVFYCKGLCLVSSLLSPDAASVVECLLFSVIASPEYKLLVDKCDSQETLTPCLHQCLARHLIPRSTTINATECKPERTQDARILPRES